MTFKNIYFPVSIDESMITKLNIYVVCFIRFFTPKIVWIIIENPDNRKYSMIFMRRKSKLRSFKSLSDAGSWV